MRVSLLSSTAVALALLAGGCNIEDPNGMEVPLPYEELGQAVAGVTCAADPDEGGPVATVACSDPTAATPLVYTSLYRVGHNAEDTAFSEIAQKFKVSAGGAPGQVRLKLRLLRPLALGENPVLYVDIREVVGDVIGDESTTFARGYVQVAALARGLPAEETILLSQVGATTVLFDPAKEYAMVLRTTKPDAGVSYVGVASHKDLNPYGDGIALRRTGNTQTPGSFNDQGYLSTPGDYDLSFSVSVNDGGAPPACWSTTMVWGVSKWTAEADSEC